LATSLADTRTRPSVIFVDLHLPKVSKLTAPGHIDATTGVLVGYSAIARKP
jgi:hypothetical protein